MKTLVAFAAIYVLAFLSQLAPGARAQFVTGGPASSGGGGSPAAPTDSVQYNAGAGNFGGALLGDGQILVGQTGAPGAETLSGDCTLADTGAITCTQAASFNITNNGGFEVIGNQMIGAGAVSTVDGQSRQSLFIGLGAGAAYTLSGDTGYSSTGVGNNALESLTQTNAEDTCFGAWSCQYITTGQLNTALGMHALGQATTSTGDTVFGNDSMRNAIPGVMADYTTALGQGTLHDGSPQGKTTAVGPQALYGNASSIILSGTCTPGDTVNVTLSASGSTPGSVVGLPSSYTYTTPGGCSLGLIATALANNLVDTVTGPGVPSGNGVVEGPVGDGTYYVSFQWPGTGTLGWAITVSTTVTGAQTEVLTVNNNGSQPNAITAVGSGAGQGYAMGAASNDVFIGDEAGQQIHSDSDSVLIGTAAGERLTNSASGAASDTFVGYNSGINATTSYGSSFYGFQSGDSVTTGRTDTFLGAKAGFACTTCANVTALGFNVGSTAPTTSVDVILIGAGDQAVTSSTSNSINIENVWEANGTGTPATSTTTLQSQTFSFPNISTAAATSCGTTPTACLQVTIGGVTHYVPYY